MILGMYDDNGNFGVRCPNRVTVSKNLPTTVYIGSENCLRCFYFGKIKQRNIICKYKKTKE